MFLRLVMVFRHHGSVQLHFCFKGKEIKSGTVFGGAEESQ